MVVRVVRTSALIVLIALALTGCGWQASKESSQKFSLPVTGPDRKVLPTSRPSVSAALDAAGGLLAWKECTKIEAGAVVTACAPDGCFYLTEQDFVLCPWSDAIQVTAHEPQADLVWQVVGEQDRAPRADPNLQGSPLASLRGDYADALLQIATAPVRLLEDDLVLTPRPATVQIAGQWYLPLEVSHRTLGGRLRAGDAETDGTGEARSRPQGPRWTQRIYFQDTDSSLVDMIWLGNSVTQKFLLVRGYDYARTASGGVRIPTKIEVFQSDPEANIGSRLALVELKQ